MAYIVMACVGMAYVVMAIDLAARLVDSPPQHAYIYIGHNDIGHNYIRLTYIGHICTGPTYAMAI